MIIFIFNGNYYFKLSLSFKHKSDKSTFDTSEKIKSPAYSVTTENSEIDHFKLLHQPSESILSIQNLASNSRNVNQLKEVSSISKVKSVTQLLKYNENGNEIKRQRILDPEWREEQQDKFKSLANPGFTAFNKLAPAEADRNNNKLQTAGAATAGLAVGGLSTIAAAPGQIIESSMGSASAALFSPIGKLIGSAVGSDKGAVEGSEFGQKLGEYLADGFFHPAMAIKDAVQNNDAKLLLGPSIKRTLEFPYYDAYGKQKGKIMKGVQGLQSLATETSKWSGSVAATGSLFLINPVTAPAVTPVVTSAAGVTAVSLATKTGLSMITSGFANNYANYYYDFIDKDEGNQTPTSIKKYCLVLADANNQTQTYGMSLFQSALMLGGGQFAENMGNLQSPDSDATQLSMFKETVGLGPADANLAEVLAGLIPSMSANTADDIESLQKAKGNEENISNGLANIVSNVLPPLTKGTDDAKGYTENEVNSGGLAKDANWSKIKNDKKFRPPKKRLSLSNLLNPIYLFGRVIRGVLQAAQHALDFLNGDQDVTSSSQVTDEEAGNYSNNTNIEDEILKGTGLAISGSIGAAVGGVVGGVGGGIAGMVRGAKTGVSSKKEDGTSKKKYYNINNDDSMLKKAGKGLYNFGRGAVGLVGGAIAGTISGGLSGAAGGAVAGAENAYDSIYGEKASKRQFAGNLLGGGVAAGVSASRAVSNATSIKDFSNKLEENRKLEIFLRDTESYCSSAGTNISNFIDTIKDMFRSSP